MIEVKRKMNRRMEKIKIENSVVISIEVLIIKNIICFQFIKIIDKSKIVNEGYNRCEGIPQQLSICVTRSNFFVRVRFYKQK